MKKKIVCLFASLFLAEALSAKTGSAISITYQGYNPADSQFDLTLGIMYMMPDPSIWGPGPYPIFIWTPGSYEWYYDTMSLTFIQQMAKRGFIGASVQYANLNSVQICNTYTPRAQGIFDTTRSTSAAGVLCKLPGAGCSSKGIVNAGISEGAVLAVLAKNYAPSVKATYGISVSDYNQNGPVDLSACLDKQYTAIPADRLFIANGASDTTFGGQTPLQNVSGYTCATGTVQCWSPEGNGSGWYIVQNSQVIDGVADHCYQMVGGCTGITFDSNWYLLGTYNWSMPQNLDWLASLGTKRIFSTSGY